MTERADSQRFEAIIVGAGAAGSWAAKELTEAGLRVLLLDAGRNIDPAIDFPEPVPAANPILSRVGATLSGQHIQARSISFGASTQHFYVNDRECRYVTARDSPFLWIRGRQVGGRLHTWGRSALRMSDKEFQGPGSRQEFQWPIRYADLAPYYDRVEQTLEVHGRNEGLDSVPDGIFIPPLEISPAEQLLKDRIKERTGLTLMHNRVVRYRRSRIPLPIQLAGETGRLTIRPDTVVSRITIDGTTGKARGIGYFDRSTRQYAEINAPLILLCASAFESVRILLNSACDRHPQGVGASSGVLGNYICDHVSFGKGGPLSGEYLEAQKAHSFRSNEVYDFGVYSMYLPNFCGKWGATPDFEGGYGLQIGCMQKHWWALAFGEMLPRYENRLQLSKRKRDAWDIPAAEIVVRHAENEDRMARHISTSVDAIFREAGLSAQFGGHKAPRFYQRWIVSMLKKRLFAPNGLLWPGASIHETGGARMGSDPRTSVVNAYGQVWDAPNVFVTDGACFVSPGYQNHTLTIMAITARACSYIAREFRGKDAP
jgi:choline dehydrogenase-like flavoprotein